MLHLDSVSGAQGQTPTSCSYFPLENFVHVPGEVSRLTLGRLPQSKFHESNPPVARLVAQGTRFAMKEPMSSEQMVPASPIWQLRHVEKGAGVFSHSVLWYEACWGFDTIFACCDTASDASDSAFQSTPG